MDSLEPQLVKAVMTMTAVNGDTLAMVEYPGSGCGLLRNGTPIPGMNWTPCNVERCTAELLRLSNRSASARAREDLAPRFGATE